MSATVHQAIAFAIRENHMRDPVLSVCNMLNLDPSMSTDDLAVALGGRTWESTHDERMAKLADQIRDELEMLRETDPDSPFLTGRPRKAVADAER